MENDVAEARVIQSHCLKRLTLLHILSDILSISESGIAYPHHFPSNYLHLTIVCVQGSTYTALCTVGTA